MPKADVQFGTSPFKEAVDYFRSKINLPTATWKDLQGQMHAKAFVVAGAMRDDLLADFRKAVDGAIAEGKTLQEFRKDFDSIVAKTGWQYNGSRNWRSEIIYSTNMAVAHSAGRERQMQDPEVRKIFPYGRYVCMMDGRERPAHRAWHNTVLPLDDPWWSSHTPPCGWHCRCRKEAVSRYDVKELGLSVSDKAPADPMVEHIDHDTGEVMMVHKGIDPGWDYNPGDAANGKPGVSMKAWKVIPQPAQVAEGSLPSLPIHAYPKQTETLTLNTKDEIKAAMDSKLDALFPGDSVRQVLIPLGEFTYAFNVNSEELAKHFSEIDRRDRQLYMDALLSAMTSPDEVRLAFMRSTTGKVAIRARFIKVFAEKGKQKPIMVVFDAQKGEFVSWTAYRFKPSQLSDQRTGILVYQKKEAP